MELPELAGPLAGRHAGPGWPIVLELAPHPGMGRHGQGRILRPGFSAIVVGDVHQGQLTMEESRDGSKVSGNWSGEVVDGSCARDPRRMDGRGRSAICLHPRKLLP